MDAAKWGDLTAAYVLGCWHRIHNDFANDLDWWLTRAAGGSELAAYLAAWERNDDPTDRSTKLPGPEAI